MDTISIEVLEALPIPITIPPSLPEVPKEEYFVSSPSGLQEYLGLASEELEPINVNLMVNGEIVDESCATCAITLSQRASFWFMLMIRSLLEISLTSKR